MAPISVHSYSTGIPKYFHITKPVFHARRLTCKPQQWSWSPLQQTSLSASFCPWSLEPREGARRCGHSGRGCSTPVHVIHQWVCKWNACIWAVPKITTVWWHHLTRWLSVSSELQMICIWSSRCNCHLIISCFIKMHNGLVSGAGLPGSSDRQTTVCPGTEDVKWASDDTTEALSQSKNRLYKLCCYQENAVS